MLCPDFSKESIGLFITRFFFAKNDLPGMLEALNYGGIVHVSPFHGVTTEECTEKSAIRKNADMLKLF